MAASFPHVFEPLRLRHRTLRSRINFGAHTANMAEEGLPGERHIGYYRERALGGAGMIVVEPVPVHRTGVLTRGNFRHDDDAIIPAFRRLTDACREANPDIVMIHQLYHVGQHGDADNSFAPNWSPSGLPSYHDADGSHAMTERRDRGADRRGSSRPPAGAPGERLRRRRDLRRRTTALVDQFWATWSNRRTDEWGGLVREPDALLGRDPAADPRALRRRLHHRPGASARTRRAEAFPSIAELARDRRLARRATADGLRHVRDGLVLRLLQDHPDRRSSRSGSASRSRPRSRPSCRNALVQAESHIRTPAAAEAVLAAGHADMVSIVRGQIADPHLVAKARAGRADEVRPCISCNQLCWGRRSRDYWISCLVNPSAGREWEWDGDRFEPAAAAAARPGRRRRSGRAGGGPGRGGARPSRDAHGARAGARRPVPAGRAPAVARPDHGPPRLVRPAARDASAWRSGSASRRPRTG